MRITGGSLRSRKIKAPLGPLTEPVPDMVREAVFSILQHVIPGAKVLDLFACSGSLGIEALSRGAAEVLFVERDKSASRVISENLERLGLAESASVATRDALAILPFLESRAPFDLVFVDPPYALSDDPNTLKALEVLIVSLFDTGVAARDGIVVFRRRKGGSAILTELDGFTTDTRTYGTTQVTFIEKPRTSVRG